MGMIQCESCQSELPEDSRFCWYCGRAIDDSVAETAINSNNANNLAHLNENAPTLISAQHVLTYIGQAQEEQTILDNSTRDSSDAAKTLSIEEERIKEEIIQTPTISLQVEKSQNGGVLLIPGTIASVPQGQAPVVQGTPFFDAPSVPAMPEDVAQKWSFTPDLPVGWNKGISMPYPAATRRPQSPVVVAQRPVQLSSPVLPHSRPPQRGKPPPKLAIVSTCFVIMAAITGLLLANWMVVRGAPPPSLTYSGKPVPGGPIAIRGSYFSPESQVTVTVDGAALSAGTQDKNVVAASQTAVANSDQSDDALHSTITTDTSGAFELIFVIPEGWKAGSSHIFRASEQSNRNITSAQLRLQVEALDVTPTPDKQPTPVATPKSQQPKPTPAQVVTVPTTPPVPVATPTPVPPPPPCIKTSSTALVFAGTVTKGPAAQRVTITNCGSAGNWVAKTSAGAAWLKVSPGSGSLKAGASQGLAIAVSPSGLKPGRYTGQVVVTQATQTLTVNVTFTVSAAPTPIPSPTVVPPTPTPLPTVEPTPEPSATATLSPSPEPSVTATTVAKPCIGVSPQSLAFSMMSGGSDPDAKAVTLSNCGAAGSWTAVSSNAAWLTVGPATGVLAVDGRQSVAIRVSNAACGNCLTPRAQPYSASVTFNLGTASVSVPVSVTVQSTPCIKASTKGVTFEALAGIPAVPPKMVTISNCGGPGTISAVATSDGGEWLKANLSGGQLVASGAQTLTVNVNTARLKAGSYTGQVTVTIRTASGSSQVTIAVSLTVTGISSSDEMSSSIGPQHSNSCKKDKDKQNPKHCQPVP